MAAFVLIPKWCFTRHSEVKVSAWWGWWVCVWIKTIGGMLIQAVSVKSSDCRENKSKFHIMAAFTHLPWSSLIINGIHQTDMSQCSSECINNSSLDPSSKKDIHIFFFLFWEKGKKSNDISRKQKLFGTLAFRFKHLITLCTWSNSDVWGKQQSHI